MVLSDDLLLKKSLDDSIFPATWPEIGWFKHVFLPPIRHFPPGVLEACPASRRESQHQLRLLRALEAGAGADRSRIFRGGGNDERITITA